MGSQHGRKPPNPRKVGNIHGRKPPAPPPHKSNGTSGQTTKGILYLVIMVLGVPFLLFLTAVGYVVVGHARG